MARRVRTERYDVIGASKRARRLAVVWGVWRSGLVVSLRLEGKTIPDLLLGRLLHLALGK
jgi:hypothetical protein